MNILQIMAATFERIDKGSVNIPKAQVNGAQFDNAVSVVLGIAGIVAVIFIILGGIRYSISQGNASDLQKGKDMIVYSLVGLVIVILAFTIVQLATAKVFS